MDSGSGRAEIDLGRSEEEGQSGAKEGWLFSLHI